MSKSAHCSRRLILHFFSKSKRTSIIVRSVLSFFLEILSPSLAYQSYGTAPKHQPREGTLLVYPQRQRRSSLSVPAAIGRFDWGATHTSRQVAAGFLFL